MLVHPYEELATASDAIVTALASSAPYQMIIQTDVRGMVWLTQIGQRVGHLSDDGMDLVAKIAVGEHVSTPNIFPGLHLAGILDPRWDFKLEEVEVIRNLAANCTEHLLEDSSPWRLDTGVFWLEALQEAGQGSLILRLLDAVSHGRLSFGFSDLEALRDLGVLEVDAWIETFGPSGAEYFSAFHRAADGQGIVQPLSEDEDLVASSDFVRPRRRTEAGPLCLKEGERLLTATHLWLDEISEDQTQEFELSSGKRCSMYAEMAA